ncbi:glycosyl hydrolase family 28-related protein [Paenibacillus sp. MBLB4367]|uniref:right-handed parallel beta-helix repeat-containing protein n=1 Tax=Paenibacillus sp. MBLB4367 TaxID=3384767 RepID=UPI00390803F1
MTEKKQQSNSNSHIIDTKMSRRKLLSVAGSAVVAGALLGSEKVLARQGDDEVDSVNGKAVGIKRNVEEMMQEFTQECSERLADIVTNVKSFGATGDGTTDDTAAIRDAIESIRTTGGTVLFPKGTYRCRSVVVPSNITIQGNHAVIKAKDVFYTITTSAVSTNGTSVTVQDPDGVNIGDVVSVKSNVTDLVIVTGKTGNTIQVKPMRIFKGASETHTGFKWSHASGANFAVMPQIFWVTQGLTTDSDAMDGTPKTGGVENVTITGITFVGSKNSNDYSKFTVYDLVSGGAVFFYRTANCNVSHCIFEDTYSASVVFYGWNTNFEFSSNICRNIGYVIPTTVSPQIRDSTSGVTMHWDQRYTSQTSLHVSDSYVIENNTFKHCWNGGVFASATNNGAILNNDVDDFVSHGIAVYGGDLGIGSSAVTVANNTIRNGRNTGDSLGFGMGIWLSIISKSCSAANNFIDNCEKGIVVNGMSNTNITGNTISNCTTAFIEFKLRNVSVKVSDNIFMLVYGYPDSKTGSSIVVLDSSGSANDNVSIMFQSNLYALSGSFKGSSIVSVIKSNDTLFVGEKGHSFVPFASVTDVTSAKKPKMLHCDFTGMGGSGVAAGKASLLNCMDNNGKTRTILADSVMTYNDKEVAVVNSGATGVRPTGVPVGYSYFDTTLGKPIWWSGAGWKDSSGAVM